MLLYLGASWLGATHLHAPHEHHHADCKICHILKTLHSADLPPQGSETDFVRGAEEKVAYAGHRCDRILIKGYRSHAPPPLR